MRSRRSTLVALLASIVLVGSVDAQEQTTLDPALLESIREQVRLNEYRFDEVESGEFVAMNRAQHMTARVDLQGMEVRSEDSAEAGWTLRLRTTAVGRGEARHELGLPASTSQAARVALDYGVLEEWFVNDERGIEQGWTLRARPEGELGEPLSIELALESELGLRIDESRRGAILVDGKGRTRARYTGLLAWDRTGKELDARLLSSPTGLRVEIDDSSAVYPIVVDPWISGPIWSYESNQSSAELGFSLDCAGDVNGDGVSDIIVGAYRYTNGESEEGRAFVFHGSLGGLSATPDWMAESDVADARFGWDVASAGDVNGDGYSDVIVGAPGHDDGTGNPDIGKAFVYLGSAQGLESTPVWSTSYETNWVGTIGYAVDGAGDVNGDGYSDVVISAPFAAGSFNGWATRVYHGGPNGPAGAPWIVNDGSPSEEFGRAVAGVGDLNGDGFDDLVIGAQEAGTVFTQEGAVYVYLGSASGLSAGYDQRLSSGQANTDFGSDVAAAGDVNGDGFADLLVGAENYDGSHTNEGRAYLFLGSSTELNEVADWTVDGGQAHAYMGNAVAPAGDVNGDGYGDVLVASHGYDSGSNNRGRVALYLGDASGLSSFPEWIGTGAQGEQYFGEAVAAGGDVDGDGWPDLMVGSKEWSNGQTDEGQVSVFSGGPSGPGSLTQWSGNGAAVDHDFAYDMDGAGDVNGDGFSDLVVGAPGAAFDRGRAYVFLGQATGLSMSATTLFNPVSEASRFGEAVTAAGDVNGDGYDDILIAAPRENAGGFDRGAAYLYLGGELGIETSPGWSTKGIQDDEHLGTGLAGSGDVDGDGFADISVGAPDWDGGSNELGRVLVFHGSDSGPGIVANTNMLGVNPGGRFGASLSLRGDVDRDGYSDLIAATPCHTTGETEEGNVTLFRGTPLGLQPIAAWNYQSDVAGSHLGESVASAGDVNGDGYDDVLVGVPDMDHNGSEQGFVYLFLGQPGGLTPNPAWIGTDDRPGSRFGACVDSAGDTNGDGYSDFLIGAPEDGWTGVRNGRAYLYLGSASGPSQDYARRFQLPHNYAYVGASLAGLGDSNGDGLADLVVGAYGYDFGGAVNSGYAWLETDEPVWYAGIRQLQADESAPVARLGVSETLGTVRLEGTLRSGLSSFEHAAPGEIEVFLEWEVKPLHKPFDGTDLRRSPVGVGASSLSLPHVFSGFAGRLPHGKPLHWRMRFALVGSPLLGHTPWVSLAGDSIGETKLRTLPLEVGGLGSTGPGGVSSGGGGSIQGP